MDVAKFVAIFLVCAGHAIPILVGYDDRLRHVIYSFHMPLFMLLSGFFSLHSFRQPFFLFVRKKSVQLLIPAFVFCGVSCLFLFCVGKGGLSIYLVELYGGVWFLKTLFVCFLLVYLAKSVFRSDALACLVSVLMVLPFMPALKINSMFLFFWTGYFLRKNYSRYEAAVLPTTLVAGVLFVVFCALRQTVEIPKIGIGMLREGPLRVLLLYVVGLSGSLTIVGLCHCLCSGKKCPAVVGLMSHVGRYTLGIYVMQILLLERAFGYAVELAGVRFSSGVQGDSACLFVGLVFVFLSYFTVVWCAKVPMLNLLLFGGQYKS